MLILHLCLLWALVVVHLVGGALLFHRLFRRESPWFGFVLPSIAIAMVMNFVEHGVGFSSFRWALPVTFVGSLWLIMSPKANWRRMALPTVAFVTAFTFTLLIHGLKPDIETVRDGRIDTHLIADYSMGETLPASSTWEFPLKDRYYYSFGHYSASILVRLLGLDIGTGFNVAGALLSALIFFLIGAIAWRIGGHRPWIVAVSMLLTASAMTGSTAYLWLFSPDHKEPDNTSNLLYCATPGTSYPFERILTPQSDYYAERELLPPGYWGWIGSFHSVVVGQFLTLLAVYCLVEMVRVRRTLLPWVFAPIASLLILVCSTWGLPFTALLFVCGAAYCLWKRIYPSDWRTVFFGWGIALLCLAPMLMYHLQLEAPGPLPIRPAERAELGEFVIQWWPIYLPWFAVLFFWRKLNPATLIIMALVPVCLYVMEHYSVYDRLDMTGKIWGFLFGAAWAVLFPSLASLRSWVTRGLLGVFLILGAVSVCFWVDYTHRSICDDDEWHIEGIGDYRTNAVRSRILQAVAFMDHKIILPGKCQFPYTEASDVALFSHNYNFIAENFNCDMFLNPESNEGYRRACAVNDIYDGKNPDVLAYLQDHNITAMIIWPEDHIPGDILTKLKTLLAHDYWYQDCRDAAAPRTDDNGGIFLPKIR